ncbi:MAG: spore maturation protein B [Candidatus Improbicoccus pseudotrichonymphae]|uniref:Spore maturation protein B n=1 Tax=Candidatus Improbicoccus pseudotrichonymphae TaxID=3033792 RepID=A0AA48I8A0_9FIRM|nr:MAG: spore maturation protein B [Candidatus Improbicoccus pseudotrichonymphae]
MGISSWYIPTIITFIISYAFLKKTFIFDSFILGAKSGLETTFLITPSLIGLIVAVGMLRVSGAFEMFANFISPLVSYFNFPPQLVPLAIIRPISGSASTAILDSILKNFGPDSYIGRLASLITGSTETTIYTIAIYFGSIKIKNNRGTLIYALLADLTALIISSICVKIF